MRKMLLVYPHNFLQGGMGTNNRVKALAKIFNEIGFEIDLFAFDGFCNIDNNYSNFDDCKSGFANKLYLCIYPTKYVLYNKIYNRLVGSRLIQKISNKNIIDEWYNWAICNEFRKVVKNNRYDVIGTFYANYAELFKKVKSNSKLVYFMEDSAFLQKKYNSPESKIGMLLDNELNALQIFDELFCISYDEKIMYEKFLDKEINFLPHIISKHESLVNIEKKYDLLFVGADNPYNREGILWFMDNVYPLLPKTIKILLCGKSTEVLEKIYDNVEIISFIDDIDEAYKSSRIVICPMLHGTGMKIKVVEALSYGLPVVCNPRGVDGLPNKINNGCLNTSNPLEFAGYIIHLLNDMDYYLSIVDYARETFDSVFDIEQYKKILREKLS